MLQNGPAVSTSMKQNGSGVSTSMTQNGPAVASGGVSLVDSNNVHSDSSSGSSEISKSNSSSTTGSNRTDDSNNRTDNTSLPGSKMCGSGTDDSDVKHDDNEKLSHSDTKNNIADNSSNGSNTLACVEVDSSSNHSMSVVNKERKEQNGEYDNEVSTLTVIVNNNERNSNEDGTTAVATSVHLTYDINFKDDNDSIVQAATQLVITDSQHQFSASSDNNDDNDV